MDTSYRFGVIYRATNTITGHIYIGQTTDLGKRKVVHKKRGLHEDHHNHFYNAIKKYGWENFTFEEIDSADSPETLNEREIHWIAFYRSTERGFGYNILPGGHERKHGEETRQKISESNLRAYAEGRHGGGFGCLSSEARQEAATKAAKTRHERYASGEIIHWGKGKPRPAHVIEKLKAALKKHLVKCVETGVEYASVNDAVRAVGGNKRSIAAAAKGKRETASGFHWRYTSPETNHVVRVYPTSEEFRKRTSERMKGQMPVNVRKVRCADTGEVFPSLTAAAKSVNGHATNLCRKMKGQAKYNGRSWEYVKEAMTPSD